MSSNSNGFPSLCKSKVEGEPFRVHNLTVLYHFLISDQEFNYIKEI